MGSGFANYNLSVTDPIAKTQYELLTTINTDGRKHAGGSTTQPPVVHSPYNEFVPGGDFVMQSDLDKQDRRKEAFKAERNTRDEHISLKDMLQAAYAATLYGKRINQKRHAIEINKDIRDINNIIATDDQGEK